MKYTPVRADREARIFVTTLPWTSVRRTFLPEFDKLVRKIFLKKDSLFLRYTIGLGKHPDVRHAYQRR